MPTVMKATSISTLVTIENLISGSAFEFARGNGLLSAGITGSGAGLLCNIQAGSKVVAESFDVPVKATHPVIPDEMYFGEAIAYGDRIVFRTQNPTAGTLVARLVAQFSFQG